MDDLTGRRSAGRILRITFVATIVIAGLLVPGTASSAPCGLVVKADKTLNSDITDCPGNGIVIKASDITLRLNGHTIDGDDDATGFGIFMRGRNSVRIIGPGTIKEFGTGIRVENSNRTLIKRVTVRENNATATGIVVTQTSTNARRVSNGTSIKRNTVLQNEGSGIVVYRNNKNTKVVGNRVEQNNGDGIFLGGAGDTLDIDGNPVTNEEDFAVKVRAATIRSNTTRDNGGTGIALVSSGANIIDPVTNDEESTSGGRDNVITSNVADDNGTDITFPGVGHEARRGNCCQDNGGHGIKVAGGFVNTTISDNTAVGNGTPPGSVPGFERNGAGIFLGGQNTTTRISGNVLDDNAMAGIFAGGTNRRTTITDNFVVSNNNNADTFENAGIMVVGAHDQTTLSGNRVSNNNAHGVHLEGHNKRTNVSGNRITSHANRANLNVEGRSVDTSILSNRLEGGDIGLLVRGSVLRLLIQDNNAPLNAFDGFRIWAQCSTPQGSFDPTPPDDPNTIPDEEDPLDDNCNTTTNTRLIGNSANNNGEDGFHLIVDNTVQNNTANDNTGFGILFDPLAANRGADASDGPHQLTDGGGNTATGNGTDCSVGITC